MQIDYGRHVTGDLHPTVARGYSTAADAYERARPGYPAAAIELLLPMLAPQRGAVVLDLGAGTGKLARQLVGRGVHIVAVEPVAQMRAHCAAAVPAAAVLDGRAEAIPLPAASVDGVVIAQAFHWFHGAATMVELARVLRPGGTLALIWNRPIERAPWSDDEAAILDAAGAAAQRERWDDWRDAFAAGGVFAPPARASVPHPITADVDTAVDRVASLSYVAALDDRERAGILAAVREVYARHADGSGRLSHTTTTEIHWTRRRVGQPT